MPRYSVSSMFFHEYTCDEIFSFVKTAGCSAIEFWPETPDFWLHGRDKDKLLQILDKYPDLKPVTVHGPVLDLNPCSVNPDVAEISIKNTVEAVELSEFLGAQVLTIHPGRRTAKRPAGRRDLERFQVYIDRIREASEKSGVKICIENMPPKINSLFSEPKQMRDLLDNEEWLYLTLDIAHAMTNNDRDVLDFLELAGERILNVHISRNSGTINHFPVDGDPVIGDILKILSDTGYNGFLTLELEDLNLERKITADEKISIVRNDISFIKGHFR